MSALAPICVHTVSYSTVQAALIATIQRHKEKRASYSSGVALGCLLDDLDSIVAGIAARAPVDDGEIVGRAA